MSNKDQNNTSWKNRLDELENLPGEVAPAKNMAWDKLHNRLREKKGNKKAFWYWAAAVFFILIGSIFVFNNKSDKKQEPIVQHEKAIPAANTAIVESAKSPVITTNIKPITKENSNSVNKTGKLKSSGNEVAVNNEPINRITQLTITKEPVITIVNSLPVVDSTNTAVVPKKKLRVVHLNELSDPNQTNITETDNTNNGFRRFIRHYNKDVSVGDPAPANSGGHTLIKNLNN